MNEVRVEKTVRRKFAEAILFFWGVFGMIFCLYMSHQAYQLEMAALSTGIRFSSAIPAVMMHTLIWIGGLVFLGFFALLAPVKMTIVPAHKPSLG